NGVVNNFELSYLYSIDKKRQVNVGIELALFLIRQATDTRTKGIFCGGYIRKLLMGMNVWQAPSSIDFKVDARPVQDGPFRHWGLTKIHRMRTSTREPIAPPRAAMSSPNIPTSSVGPSIAQVPPTNPSWQLYKKEFQEAERKHEKERLKNKKFRKAVWGF